MRFCEGISVGTQPGGRARPVSPRYQGKRSTNERSRDLGRWIDRLYRNLGIETKGETIPRVEATRRHFLAVGVPGASDA